jgi:hypothetical protein
MRQNELKALSAEELAAVAGGDSWDFLGMRFWNSTPNYTDFYNEPDYYGRQSFNFGGDQFAGNNDYYNNFPLILGTG